MKGFGLWNSYSSLHPNVRAAKPDSSMSAIPYEKGFQFLWFLHSLIDERFMWILIDEYVNENAHTSVKWEVFQAKFESFVDKHFSADEGRTIKLSVDW